MPKLTRGASRTFLDSTFGSENPEWWRLGKDMEEFVVELEPDVEVVRNIWDETSVKDNGYEPSAEADPYYANTDDAIYPKLLDIAMNRLKGDACKTKILEVVVEDTEASSHKAWIEDIVVKPLSYGGDTSGFSIPFSISFDGNRKEGTVTITDGKPVFVEKNASL